MPRQLGMIAQLPNAAAKFVPLPADISECDVFQVAGRVRDTLCEVFGWQSPENVRVLFRERDIDREATASDFRTAAGSGRPCFVRVLFRLLGGKGGFGALLRKQMGLGKKTTNFDAMRDLSGRRLRHAKAVDRIKEWMEEKRRQDDLVNMLTGEGPELPKPTPESDALDPQYVAMLRRSAANKPSLVREGLRKLSAEQGSAAAVQAAKRPRTEEAGAAGGGWLSALEMLGEVSSPEGEPDDGGTRVAAAVSQLAASAAVEESAPMPSEVKCRAGHLCVRATENPEEPGYEEPACCDLCDAEDLPGTCPYFFHCASCQFDLCPDCGARLASCTAASGSAPASASAAPLAKADGVDVPAASTAEPPFGSASALEPAVTASPASTLAPLAAEAASGAAAAEAAAPRRRRGGRGAGGEGAGEPEPDDGEVLTAADVKAFDSADDLLREVDPEVIKRSLRKLGLKSGGKPEERAARLFLLKSTKLGAIPKAHFAKK